MQDSGIVVTRDKPTWLYVITNKVNNKMYVGITSKTVKERWYAHVWDATSGRLDLRLSRAIKKYGAINFEIVSLYLYSSRHVAADAEIEVISQLGLLGPAGYNVSAGGEAGRSGIPHTNETKKKMAAAARGRVVSAEQRAKISATLRGRKLSPEHAAAARAGQARWIANLNDEDRARMGNHKRGVKHTAEHRAKISAGLLRHYAKASPEVRT